ncbi:MAG: hypothetical protein WBZ36_22110 [Candidatus Nitrosopolaris sp.]
MGSDGDNTVSVINGKTNNVTAVPTNSNSSASSDNSGSHQYITVPMRKIIILTVRTVSIMAATVPTAITKVM